MTMEIKLQNSKMMQTIHDASESKHIQRELRRHAHELMKQSEDQMKEKLDREQEKSQKVKHVEQKYVEWAESKSKQFQEKQEKVVKNKEEQLAKVVKRCQNKNKYITKKQEDYRIEVRRKVNADWKKHREEEQKNQNYMSKTMKSGFSAHLEKHEPQLEQQHVSFANNTQDNQKNPMIQSTNMMNTSKIYSNMFSLTQFDMQASHNMEIKKGEKNYQTQESEECNYKEKFERTLSRLRNKESEEERGRIQQMGEKLQKIEKNRNKRKQMHAKRYQKNSIDRDRNITTYETTQKFDNNKKQNIRIKSQHSWKRESKTNERIGESKKKRQEMLEQHLLAGDQYLENLKVKYLKKMLEKNIAFSTLQKKLFLERMKN